MPPPKPKAARARKSTLKHTSTQGNIIEEDEELMDEILDDEEENLESKAKEHGEEAGEESEAEE